MLLNRLASEPNCRVLLIESICTDPIVLAHNIAMKLSSPDYKGIEEAQARDDFRKRLENYEKAYQTLDEEDEEDGIQYCKLINVGKKVKDGHFFFFFFHYNGPFRIHSRSLATQQPLYGLRDTSFRIDHCLQHSRLSSGTVHLLPDELQPFTQMYMANTARRKLRQHSWKDRYVTDVGLTDPSTWMNMTTQ